MVRGGTPTWYGHCNGWTAAAIRHAEPQMNVVRNGVVFTPADIKGLLAELYMYTESEFLGGVDMAINPATLHVSLANWLGRGSHPIGMETAVGEVVINFPIYSYKSTVRMMSPREAEVRTTIRYTLNTPREYDKGPANFNRQMYFHYALHLDEEGEIKGGHYYGDSAQIDMLWAPLKPTQGGEEGNKRGNRHLNMKEVLAIWRESVPEDLRKQWLNIDPTEEDRILPPVEAVASSSDAPAAGTAASTSSGSEASASSADGADAAEIPPLPPGRPTAASETTAADPAPAAAPTPAVTPATPTTAGEGNGSSSPERNSAGDEDAPPQ
jgi:hypothetical protein